MTPKTKLAHAATLWQAIRGKPEKQQCLTMAEAIDALGVAESYVKSIVRTLEKAGIAYPPITDWNRRKAKEEYQTPPPERLNGSLEMPTDPRRTCETGEGFKVDPAPIVAWIWPWRNGKREFGIYYRLS